MLSAVIFVSFYCLSSVAADEQQHRVVKRQGFYYNEPNEVYYRPRPLRQKEKEEQQDLSKVPGIPGVDYPIYRSVPDTSFNCGQVPAVPGMYANVETGCQAYHVCHDGREGHQGASFLCTNGTLFNQKEFTCDWWYNVDCREAPYFYNLNADPIKNPYAPKPKPIDHLPLEEYDHRPSYNSYPAQTQQYQQFKRQVTSSRYQQQRRPLKQPVSYSNFKQYS